MSLLIQLRVVHPKLMKIWVHMCLLYLMLSRALGQVLEGGMEDFKITPHLELLGKDQQS